MSLCWAAGLWSQRAPDMLLESVKVMGRVVDEQQKPVIGARVDGERWTTVETGPDGRFELVTQAPAVVVRMAGFHSKRIAARSPELLSTVTLERLTAPALPLCSDKLEGAQGSQASAQPGLRLPRVKGVRVGKQKFDVDYWDRVYTVRSPRGKAAIRHGSGHTYTLGYPLEEDVWRSREFAEAVYAVGRVWIIDSRGVDQGGLRWRYLGLIAESAEYTHADAAAARLLDKVLDGVCYDRPVRRANR